MRTSVSTIPMTLRLPLAGLLALPLLACATAAPAVVELPGAVVRPTSTGPDAFEVYDDETLATRARDLVEGDACADALPLLERLVAEFPASPHALTARFQAAHCALQVNDGARALGHIDAYLEALPSTTMPQVRRNALFKRGAALAMLERHPEAAALFDEMLGDDALPLRDEVEALVDAGISHFMNGDRPTAEYRFLKARRLYQRASPSDKAALRYFVAQAAFYLAELARLEFTDLKLRFPSAQELQATSFPTLEAFLGDQLEEKCQLLLRAQYMFLRVIREEHHGWASAAGFKVGAMYEELYDELMGLPDPSDLDDEGRRMFRRVLKDKVLILLEKAVRVWQATADMASRTGTDNEWVEKTRQSLARVKSFVLAAAHDEPADKATPAREES